MGQFVQGRQTLGYWVWGYFKTNYPFYTPMQIQQGSRVVPGLLRCRGLNFILIKLKKVVFSSGFIIRIVTIVNT